VVVVVGMVPVKEEVVMAVAGDEVPMGVVVVVMPMGAEHDSLQRDRAWK
jgi:hypothetical protein